MQFNYSFFTIIFDIDAKSIPTDYQSSEKRSSSVSAEESPCGGW